jgi:hypothetical protein
MFRFARNDSAICDGGFSSLTKSKIRVNSRDSRAKSLFRSAFTEKFGDIEIHEIGMMEND